MAGIMNKIGDALHIVGGNKKGDEHKKKVDSGEHKKKVDSGEHKEKEEKKEGIVDKIQDKVSEVEKTQKSEKDGDKIVLSVFILFSVFILLAVFILFLLLLPIIILPLLSDKKEDGEKKKKDDGGSSDSDDDSDWFDATGKKKIFLGVRSYGSDQVNKQKC